MEPGHKHVIWNGTWHKDILARSILSLKDTLRKFSLAMCRLQICEKNKKPTKLY